MTPDEMWEEREYQESLDANHERDELRDAEDVVLERLPSDEEPTP